MLEQIYHAHFSSPDLLIKIIFNNVDIPINVYTEFYEGQPGKGADI